jgi:hypothetical protein
LRAGSDFSAENGRVAKTTFFASAAEKRRERVSAENGRVAKTTFIASAAEKRRERLFGREKETLRSRKLRSEDTPWG